MKKSIILGFCLLGAIVSGGCGQPGRPAGTETYEEKPVKQVIFPDKYEEKIERVNFQTSIVLPENFDTGNLRESKVTIKMPDLETAQSVFKEEIDGKKVKEEFNEPATSDNPFAYYHILTEDIYSFSVGRGVKYNSPFSYYLQHALSYDLKDNLTEEYYGHKEPEDMDRNTFLSDAGKVMEQLGYSMDGRMKSLFLPHEFLAEKEMWMNVDGNDDLSMHKTEWTEEDDTWYFLMHQTHQGLPVYHQYVFSDCNDRNTPIRIACSRRGLESLEIDYYFDFELQEKRIELLDFDSIARNAAEKYNSLLTDAEYLVKEAVLYQAVLQDGGKEYDTVPAWWLELEEKTEDDTYYIHVLMNAVTGEEIVQ